MKLAGKVVALTGAGSGMGREMALELVRRGARVAAVDIDEAALQALATDRADVIATFTVNVAHKAAAEALPHAVIERFGGVDGLINNAGIIQPFLRVNDLDYAAIDRVFAVNWSGVLYLTKAFLPHLLERPEGHIVNVSSMGGFLPVPGQAVYGASKAAVKLFTEALWAELAETRVRVTVVFPGAVATKIAEHSGVRIEASPATSRRRIMPADDAARQILDGMERDAFRVIVGRDASMMDKLYRLAPRRATALLARQMKDLLDR